MSMTDLAVQLIKTTTVAGTGCWLACSRSTSASSAARRRASGRRSISDWRGSHGVGDGSLPGCSVRFLDVAIAMRSWASCFFALVFAVEGAPRRKMDPSKSASARSGENIPWR